MANTIQIKRGLEANRTGITPAEGELIYTTDNKEFFIGDGVTAGGNQISPGTGGGIKSVQVFSANGTWNKPVGVTAVKVFVTGGGGGGGGAVALTQGGGGGAGGTAIELIDVSAIASETITVGAAGLAGISGGGNGGNGGTSSFGAHCSGNGGVGGTGSSTDGGDGGTASGGNTNAIGGDGSETSGGSSYWGGGGRKDVPARPGAAFGSGGGGHEVDVAPGAGGAGKIGIIVVWEYE